MQEYTESETLNRVNALLLVEGVRVYALCIGQVWMVGRRSWRAGRAHTRCEFESSSHRWGRMHPGTSAAVPRRMDTGDRFGKGWEHDSSPSRVLNISVGAVLQMKAQGCSIAQK